MRPNWSVCLITKGRIKVLLLSELQVSSPYGALSYLISDLGSDLRAGSWKHEKTDPCIICRELNWLNWEQMYRRKLDAEGGTLELLLRLKFLHHLSKTFSKINQAIFIYSSIKKRDVSLSGWNDSFKSAMFVYDSFKAPRSSRGDRTSVAWILEEWGEHCPTLCKLRCWSCFCTMIHTCGRVAWAMCLVCFFFGTEMNWCRQAVCYLSLCLFTLNALLSMYVWWQSQSWWQLRGNTQKGNSMMRLSQQCMFIHHWTPFMPSSHCMTFLGRFRHHSLNPSLFPCGWCSCLQNHVQVGADGPGWALWTKEIY